MWQLTCNWISAILFQENSNSFSGTFACFKYLRNPSSSGRSINKACPELPSPRAVRPTRWMYSWIITNFSIEHKMISGFCNDHITFGSSGGSNCTIQSTAGMSRPRAATSVHKRVPVSALQNWKKVVVRFVCFCLPLWWRIGSVLVVDQENYLSCGKN